MQNGYAAYNDIQRLIIKLNILFPNPRAYEEFMKGLATILEI